jgi:hypothetical protein
MTKVVAAGFCLIVGVELAALFLPDRRMVLAMAGVAVALALLAVRWFLAREPESWPTGSDADDAAKALRRWLSRTETLVGRSESTRLEWDRHLRPMLARQFEMATGQKRAKDRAAYQATGNMLFGAELWAWVDPENVARAGADEPGPGREVLGEILHRLEQV